MRIRILAVVTVAAMILSGCETSTVVDPTELSTWEVVQQQIFEPNCANCHKEGTSFAAQSGLILTADVAYEELINVVPKNAAAAEDGLVLLGTEGLASLQKSFLWEKINALDQEHFYADHPEYGSIMPLGDPLTNGEIEFIRKWIVEGAPKDGQVAQLSILEDTVRYVAPDFKQLAPPEQGYQIHIPPFEIQPNFEREFFEYYALNNPEEIFVKRVEISMRPGSHHYLLYGFDKDTPPSEIPDAGVRRELREPDGTFNVGTTFALQYHQFAAGTQWPFMDYTFPEGYALRLPANTGLDQNPHYINYTDKPIQGEVFANLHTVDASEVTTPVEILDLNNFDLNLPPNRVTTVDKTFTFREKRTIIQLFSHAHQMMTEFRVNIVGGPRDGELVYVAYDWEHPPILRLDPPLELEAGQGLKLTTTYNNTTNSTLRFGFLSTDEMMILFGYYF